MPLYDSCLNGRGLLVGTADQDVELLDSSQIVNGKSAEMLLQIRDDKELLSAILIGKSGNTCHNVRGLGPEYGVDGMAPEDIQKVFQSFKW